jgi:Ig-like domain CHU_C associated/Bacterial Ig domain
MKRLMVLLLGILISTHLWAQPNLAIPNYTSQNMQFYWGSYAHTLALGHQANGVCFYQNEMFVAYDDGAGTELSNGIMWFTNVSFVGGIFSASQPVLLVNNQRTLDVETDAEGNVYALNRNGSITKFIRNATTPYYETIQQATVQIPNNNQSSDLNFDGLDGGGMYLDLSSNTLWVAWKGVVVCKLNNFQTSGFKIINAIAPNVSNPGNTSNINYLRTGSIAKTNAGDFWVAGGGGSQVVANIRSSAVQSIIGELNASNYATKNLTPTTDFYPFSFFGCCTNGQLGLVFDDGNVAKMYYRRWNDFTISTQICSFVPTSNGTAPAISTLTFATDKYGNSNMAIIPCELMYAPPSASGATVNAGQSATLTASGCSAPFGYEWKDGSTVVGTNSSYTTPALLSNKTYTIACKDGSCRSFPQNVQVQVTPFALNSSNPTICAGSSSNLVATGCGTSLIWNTGATTPSIWVSPTDTTTYTATCAEVGTLPLTINVLPNALTVSSSVPFVSSYCGTAIFLQTGQTTTLTATGCTNTVIWDNTTVSNSYTVPKPTETQWVFARCTQTNGCRRTETIQVSNNVVRDDKFSTGLNTPLTANVFTNDIEIGSLNAPLSLSQNMYAFHGSVSWEMDMNGLPTGRFTYTPHPSFQGLDSFNYFVTNGMYCSLFATVQIAVGVPCPTILYVNGTDNAPPYPTNKLFQATDKIVIGQHDLSVAPLTIHQNNGNSIIIRAANSIEITKGTLIAPGVVLKAEIGGCY